MPSERYVERYDELGEKLALLEGFLELVEEVKKLQQENVEIKELMTCWDKKLFKMTKDMLDIRREVAASK